MIDRAAGWDYRRSGLLLLSVALLLVAAGLVIHTGLPDRAEYTGWSIAGQFIAPEVGAQAPLFERPSLDGSAVDLADLRGGPVIINFWATWCVPCELELPILQEIYTRYQPDGLRILAVNMGEPPAQTAGWLADRGLMYDILLDPGQQVTVLYRVRVQPSTFIVAPDGIITHIFYGPVAARQLENALAPYLS